MAQINYAAYKEILEALKKKTRDLLANTKNQDLMSKLDAELESATERKNLSIAFVGQYNGAWWTSPSIKICPIRATRRSPSSSAP